MGSSPSWATDTRATAEKTFTSLPALTGQEEAWRFTPPADLALEGPEPEARAATDNPAAPAVDTDHRAATLALTDGRPAPVSTGSLPDGVIVAELGDALATHEASVRKRLYSLVGFDEGDRHRPLRLPRSIRNGPDLHGDRTLGRRGRRAGAPLRDRPGRRCGRWWSPSAAMSCASSRRCGASGADRDARALGLFFASGDQHFEHRVIISRHEAPNAYSVDEDRLGDAVALEGVARFPARVKVCSAFNGWR